MVLHLFNTEKISFACFRHVSLEFELKDKALICAEIAKLFSNESVGYWKEVQDFSGN